MKTFKKLLALVLAVVMCLALVTVAAGAEEFTDAESIDAKCETSVGVLTGMGIINGYDDGTFKPDAEVTREQAAKIIAYMLLGATDADVLKAGAAPFDDVAADRWSAGYIAFCQAKNIINGKDGNLFDPTGTITGTEFAKMLLAACGYGAAGEYVGAGWDSNVNVDALDYGVFTGNLAGMGVGLVTREWACLYAYNAMTKVLLTKYNKVTGQYSTPAGTLAKNNYGYDTSAAAKYYDASEVITAVDYVKADASTGAPAKLVAATTNGFTFDVDSFDVIGNTVSVYFKAAYTDDPTPALDEANCTVYYVDFLTKSAVVADADKLTDKDYSNVSDTPATLDSAVAIYTNYYRAASATTDTLADGDVVIYTVNPATGAKTIVAIQRDSWTDGEVKDNLVAANPSTGAAAYHYAYLDLGTDVNLVSGNTTAQAIGGYYFGTATFAQATVAGTPKSTYVYYRELGTTSGDKYYEINAVDYVTGTATRFDSANGIVTINGAPYGKGSFTVGTSGTNIILGQSYTFRVGQDGTLLEKVSSSVVTDYTGYKLGYIAGIYSTTTFAYNPANGGNIETTTKYYNIGFIDGTYGTYTVATRNGDQVISNADYTARVSAGTATGYYNNNSLADTGFVMAKVSGTSVDVITTIDAVAYTAGASIAALGDLEDDVYTSGGIAPTTLTKATTQFNSTAYTYVSNDTVFAYIENAEESASAAEDAFKMVFVKGAHDFNGARDDVANVSTKNYDERYTGAYVVNTVAANTNTTIAMFVIDAPYYVSSSTPGTSYYYVVKALGQTATGYEYEAYKVGETTKTVLTVTNATGDVDLNKFYTVTTNAGATVTYTLAGKTDEPTGIISGLTSSVVPFELNGKTYLDTAATYIADSDIVVVDARVAPVTPITSVAGITAGRTVIALYDNDSTATNKANIVSYLFIVG